MLWFKNKNVQLLEAAKHGNTSTIENLVKKGADINTKDPINGYTPLMHSLYQGHSDAAKVLISLGANVNIQDNTGISPLMIAAVKGQKDIVQILIDKGADKNYKEMHGRTALMLVNLLSEASNDDSFKSIIELL